MKNILTIDTINDFNVLMLSNIDAGVGVNRVYFELICDPSQTTTATLSDGTVYTATGTDYIFEIPQDKWVGTGDLTVTLAAGSATKVITIHKISAIQASIFLKQTNATEYYFVTTKSHTDQSLDSLIARVDAVELVNDNQDTEITGLSNRMSAAETNISSKISSSEKGVSNGVATLNGSGLVPSSQLPSYVDDVLEYNTFSDFPVTGERGKIYIALDTNAQYRWSGTEYILLLAMADIATVLSVGVVKPDGSTITIDLDGTIHADTSIVDCSTARNVANKTVSLTGFILKTGSRIAVRFTDTTTTNPASGNLTLNVNNTGAKNIVDGHSNNSVMTYANAGFFYNNYVADFIYNGTSWVYLNRDNNTTYSNQSLGNGYGTCSTAAATAAKEVALSGYNLTINGYVSVKFTYDVPANATMNINAKGAKNIFYRGARVTAGIIKAGDIATFIYDGTQYQVIGIDRNSAGSSAYVSGKTVYL